jgi:DNA-binding winged helix-turn-helix (wHTH) protein/Tfp pilus assembly protein PilF
MPSGEVYEFGPFTLNAPERLLSKNGQVIALAPKAHELLLALVRCGGRLATRRELLNAVWREAFVEEGILSVHISALRKALGDDQRQRRYIETVPRAGYRFVAATRRMAFPPGSSENGSSRTTLRAPSKPEIHEWVGRGRYHLLLFSMFEVSKAVEAFQAAIALDPTYAPAHAGLALAHCAQATMRVKPVADSYDKARAAALRALALDDSSADARVALGAVMLFSEWNWAAAERSLQRALELNPNHSEAYLLYGQLLEAMGRLADGRAMKMKALERDPFSPLVHLQIAMSCWHQRCYDESIVWANKTLELDPQHPHVREHISAAWLKKGDPDRWMEENLRHAAVHKAPPEVLQQLKDTYAAGGYKAVVAMVLRRPAAAPPMQLAILHGELGEVDLAFEWLDRAIDSRDPCLIHLAVAPQWDTLRSDARFPRALSRVGLPESI